MGTLGGNYLNDTTELPPAREMEFGGRRRQEGVLAGCVFCGAEGKLYFLLPAKLKRTSKSVSASERSIYSPLEFGCLSRWQSPFLGKITYTSAEGGQSLMCSNSVVSFKCRFPPRSHSPLL